MEAMVGEFGDVRVAEVQQVKHWREMKIDR